MPQDRHDGNLVADAADASVAPASGDPKHAHRRFYDDVTKRLDALEVGVYSYFLNLGYIADESPQYAQADVPAHAPNATSVKLALEVIADCDLTDRRLLDVGCGRGGTISVAATYFAPRQVTGIDLSGAAVAFDQRTHGGPAVRFCQGDAEHLPFADASFDVVSNIESSHTYPALHAFYAEVYRVLAPGGEFLYADLLPVPKMIASVEALKRIGFFVLRERDVTNNVLRSCDRVAPRRLDAFGATHDDVLENFLSTPGSSVYESMRSGASTFRIFTLHKPR